MPRASAPMVFDVLRGRSAAPVHGAEVFVRRTATTIGRFAEDGWWLGELVQGQRVFAAAYEWHRTAAGNVHIYRADL